MNSALVEAICHTYHLGKNLSDPVQVDGGLLHDNWKLTTTKGSVFIKVLNPMIVNQEDRRKRYQITNEISEKMKKFISTASALTPQHNALFTFENDTVMVFPFISGQTISFTKIESNHLTKISQMLKNIHQANVAIKDPPAVELLQEDFLKKFEEYTTQICFHPIAKLCEQSFSLIQQIHHEYDHFRGVLNSNLIISHRDFDPKNVLWDANENGTLIDWESAGLINKMRDLVSTALYWSLNKNFVINFEYFSHFIKVYQGKKIEQEEMAMGCYGLIGDWLGWLNFNLFRVLNHSSGTAEFHLGIAEVQNTLTALPILYKQIAGQIREK